MIKDEVQGIMRLSMDINRSYQMIFEKNADRLHGDHRELSHHCGVLRRISTNVYLSFEDYYDQKKTYKDLKEMILGIDSNHFSNFDLHNQIEMIKRNLKTGQSAEGFRKQQGKHKATINKSQPERGNGAMGVLWRGEQQEVGSIRHNSRRVHGV
jgi:hypothetical protein